MSGDKAGVYLRVSTEDQDPENQREALKPFLESRGLEPEWYVDHGLSGGSKERPEYQRLMENARTGAFSIVVVWKLDRFGRTLLQLINDLHQLQEWGVGFVSYTEAGIDTTTAMGRGIAALLASFAEMERETIRERTRAAYQRKKAQATKGKLEWGRPQKEVDRSVIEKVVAGNLSQKEAAERLGVSQPTVSRRVNEFKREREAIQNGGV